jgi:uracil-DNA glycosylase
MMSVAKKSSRKSADAPAPVPAGGDWDDVREAARGCRACPLWKNATQTVFGEGPCPSKIMLVGEQPGDQEDIAGHPFVGPAGQVLERALEDAGLHRDKLYVTNSVKHFKWEPRGKRRLHQKPSARELAACRPWLEAELNLVKPRVVVALGATAVATLLGSQVRVMRDRGRFFSSPVAGKILVTIHPSMLLRLQEHDERAAEYERFVADLRLVKKA